MLVNCLDLKKKMPKEQCWKAPNHKYYSCEAAYMAMKTERRATAKDTGEKKPLSMLFKAPNGFYYSSEAAYLNMRQNVEWRNRCTAKIQDILGYAGDMKLPTNWYKYLNSYSNYGFDVVYDTIITHEKSFLWALENKEFRNDCAVINYFNAIIQNNINEQYRKKKAKARQEIKDKLDEAKAEIEHAPSYLAGIGRSSVKGKDLSSLVGIE